MIKRAFIDVSDKDILELESASLNYRGMYSNDITWSELLKSDRILIISNAGSGKTYECKNQAKLLWQAGEAAFFIELSALAYDNFDDCLSIEENQRFERWLSSQSEQATFFLDSIDELNLTTSTFERALNKIKRAIKNQLHRAKFVITTRPIPIDKEMVRNILPVPPKDLDIPAEQRFAKVVTTDRLATNKKDKAAPDWRDVCLLPFSDSEISEFFIEQNIEDHAALAEQLKTRGEMDFFRRPMDLIELCHHWRTNKSIQTHCERLSSSINIKLQPRDDRDEIVELSLEKAREGAERLALGMLMMRRLTIRHNAAADQGHEQAAIVPESLLTDWNPKERKTLLERPVFIFASYGRVRFHHRSVLEYLAAQRLLELHKNKNLPFNELKRLLFAHSHSRHFSRPIWRPVIAWLAVSIPRIFELVKDNEPDILFNEGDPASLPITIKKQVLRDYVTKFGQGGWRGKHVPRIQVRRFASQQLNDEVKRLWQLKIESPDVRETLLELMELGEGYSCTDILNQVAWDKDAPQKERVMAVNGLLAVQCEESLRHIASSIANGENHWDEGVASHGLLSLFPRYMTLPLFCKALASLKPVEKDFDVGSLYWQLPRVISETQLTIDSLRILRDGLVELISTNLQWDKNKNRIRSDYTSLSSALAAVCELGIKTEINDGWFYASTLAIRTHHKKHGEDEPIKSLRTRLSELDATKNAQLFDVLDRFQNSLNRFEDEWDRLHHTIWGKDVVTIKPERDLHWICTRLGNIENSLNDRKFYLELAIRFAPDKENPKAHLPALIELVADNNELTKQLEFAIKPSKYEQQQIKYDRKQKKYEQKEAKKRWQAEESWRVFANEIISDPEKAFSDEKRDVTAWDLFRAMQFQEDANSLGYWNRPFLEDYFNRSIVDTLRETLMEIWRKEKPTLAYERPKGEESVRYDSWEQGLAGVSAESENKDWAIKLTDSEVKIASRLSMLDYNRFPSWLENLMDKSSEIVLDELGPELTFELNAPSELLNRLDFLRKLKSSTEAIIIPFLPLIIHWLVTHEHSIEVQENSHTLLQRLEEAVEIVLKHGDKVLLECLLNFSQQQFSTSITNEANKTWVAVILQLDPDQGIDHLEQILTPIEVEKRSEAVKWIAALFNAGMGEVKPVVYILTPRQLYKLLVLVEKHVLHEHDNQHYGVYRPDFRDNAERVRSYLFNMLLGCKGVDAHHYKLALANNDLFINLRERILTLAEESLAQEIDSVIYSEQEILQLESSGIVAAKNNEAMFAVLQERLTDLDEMLVSDTSLRDIWSLIKEEKLMRRAISRELTTLSKSVYTIDQECVTSEEKEMDIRLCSKASDHEAVIELKLGHKWSGRQLRDTIEDQLVSKYMAPENRKSGALLITISEDKSWEVPKVTPKKQVDVEELSDWLNKEAKLIQEKIGNINIFVHILDLRAPKAAKI